MRKEVGLIVGRLQPFHIGHLHLIKEALKRVDQLTIAIGSSNITDTHNPLDYNTRKKMLEKVIQHENLHNKITKIVPSPDIPDDKEWTQDLIQNAGHFDIMIGNNSWTNECLKNEGYEIIKIPYLDRNKFQGKAIRKKIRNGEKWHHLVPSYLFDDIEKNLPSFKN